MSIAPFTWDLDPDRDSDSKGGLNPDRIQIDCVYTECNQDPGQDPDKWFHVNVGHVHGLVRWPVVPTMQAGCKWCIILTDDNNVHAGALTLGPCSM